MMLEFQTIVFYGFSIVALTAALGVVLSRNPVYSALFMVAAFVACAGVWLLLHAEFLAIVLVLVYVGAVMVLFLFVLMMLDIHVVRRSEGLWRHLPLAAVFSGGLVWALSAVLADESFAGARRFAAAAPQDDNTRALGAVLYTDYAYPFELAAVLLLVAIVAAVALTLRRRKNTKTADPAKQVLADSRRQVRLVAMPAEVAAAAATDAGDADAPLQAAEKIQSKTGEKP